MHFFDHNILQGSREFMFKTGIKKACFKRNFFAGINFFIMICRAINLYRQTGKNPEKNMSFLQNVTTIQFLSINRIRNMRLSYAFNLQENVISMGNVIKLNE